MDNQKLVVCVMGENCQRTIDMCLESVKNADDIVYCDGGSIDNTKDIVASYDNVFAEYPNIAFIQNEFNQNDPTMNGKQRNFYLNYLKENYPNHWALCLDADEIVEDIDKVKEFINKSPEGVYSVKMRHFIGDLGHEDSTVQEHFVPNRLFKISCADKYPEVEHPILLAKPNTQISATDCTVIWHLAYIPNLWEIKKRYENHLKKSNIHTPEYLKSWYYQHIFGQYPKNPINLLDIPKIILNKFGVDKDEFYFANRNIEVKHPIMVKQWNDYFKPKNVLDLGCGRGCYLYFWQWYVEAHGIEISDWAVKNALCPKVVKGDITDLYDFKYDLVTAIDVLEHLNDEQLDKALKNISKSGNRFLFSIPFIGDPNLEKDNTHKQFKTKEEWVKLIENYGIKIIETPKDWLFAHQILVGRKI